MNDPVSGYFRYKAILILVLLLSLIIPDLFAQSSDQTHTVRSGDTLYSISRQYNISVSELRDWNNLENDDLETGIILSVAPPERDSVTHTVSPQETLFSISRQYNVSIAEIQQWNDLESTILSSDQDLVIYTDHDAAGEELPQAVIRDETEPGEEAEQETEAIPRESIVTPVQSANTYYTVQSGDYLNRIASEHGMTTNELRNLNNLDSDMLRVGQRLIVREIRSIPVVAEDFEESTPQGRFVNYRLESDESKSAILERFSMTEAELESLNPGTNTDALGGGQRITVLLPPIRDFENPYRKQGGLSDLGETSIIQYEDTEIGIPTTSGELYNPDQLTAAHANMALGSIVYVENPENGLGSYVKINDRFSDNGMKLSRQAYDFLGFASSRSPRAVIYQEE